MTKPDIDQLRAQHPHGLKPLTGHQPTEKPETPAADQPITEDATIGNEERIRGIPAVGRVSGTIKGTRPGDPAKDIDRDAQRMNDQARQIVKQHMREARRQLGRPDAP